MVILMTNYELVVNLMAISIKENSELPMNLGQLINFIDGAILDPENPVNNKSEVFSILAKLKENDIVLIFINTEIMINIQKVLQIFDGIPASEE